MLPLFFLLGCPKPAFSLITKVSCKKKISHSIVQAVQIQTNSYHLPQVSLSRAQSHP